MTSLPEWNEQEQKSSSCGQLPEISVIENYQQQEGACGGPWDGPVPPKPGYVHINLGFSPDAGVTLLSHILSPGHPPAWLSA